MTFKQIQTSTFTNSNLITVTDFGAGKSLSNQIKDLLIKLLKQQELSQGTLSYLQTYNLF
jgi:hypothetical protein